MYCLLKANNSSHFHNQNVWGNVRRCEAWQSAGSVFSMQCTAKGLALHYVHLLAGSFFGILTFVLDWFACVPPFTWCKENAVDIFVNHWYWLRTKSLCNDMVFERMKNSIGVIQSRHNQSTRQSNDVMNTWITHSGCTVNFMLASLH